MGSLTHEAASHTRGSTEELDRSGPSNTKSPLDWVSGKYGNLGS